MKSVYCISFTKISNERGQLLESGVLPKYFERKLDAEIELYFIYLKSKKSGKNSLSNSRLRVERENSVETYGIEELNWQQSNKDAGRILCQDSEHGPHLFHPIKYDELNDIKYEIRQCFLCGTTFAWPLDESLSNKILEINKDAKKKYPNLNWE